MNGSRFEFSPNLFKQTIDLTISGVVRYFTILSVAFHDAPSLFGFFTLLIFINQIISGIMLSFSLVPEPMLIPAVRDEEDLEDLYIDDFFWIHERGVDLAFIFSYFHLLRKLYLGVFDYEQDLTWKSGIFTFLIFQVVVFFGLSLCCTHLSEITLTIAANIFHTFFGFYGKPYWWFFTDQQLNTDTLVRIAYGHYLSAFYIVYIGVIHAFDMHYDWKNESSYDGIDFDMSWWDEALSSELSHAIDAIVIFTLTCWILYPSNEALSYEIFMWGDVGFVTDIRYYGVAPHWYFRPFMAWLIVCPHHRTGVFGLIFFFFILVYQPNIHGTNEQIEALQRKSVYMFFFKSGKSDYFHIPVHGNTDANFLHQFLFFIFMMCLFYTTTFLPYGRFYNRIGGNIGMLGSYFFVFFWLTFAHIRKNLTLDFFLMHSQWLEFFFRKYVFR